MKAFVAMIAFSCMLTACHKTEPYPEPFDFKNYTPEHSLAAFGGTLHGYDAGEWGGKLTFRGASGKTVDVLSDNVAAIIPSGENVVVLTGLSHLSINRGHIHLLMPDDKQSFKVQGLYALKGAPENIRVDSRSGDIRFRVFTGEFDMQHEAGAAIFACNALKSDYRLLTLPHCDDADTESATGSNPNRVKPQQHESLHPSDLDATPNPETR